MAQADIMAPVPLRPAAPKPKLTIYVVLLIIALVAILVGCLFLYLEIRGQGGFGTVKGRISSVQQPVGALLAGAPDDAAVL